MIKTPELFDLAPYTSEMKKWAKPRHLAPMKPEVRDALRSLKRTMKKSAKNLTG